MPQRDEPLPRRTALRRRQQVRCDAIGTVATGGDDPFGLGRVIDHVDAVTNLPRFFAGVTASPDGPG